MIAGLSNESQTLFVFHTWTKISTEAFFYKFIIHSYATAITFSWSFENPVTGKLMSWKLNLRIKIWWANLQMLRPK